MRRRERYALGPVVDEFFLGKFGEPEHSVLSNESSEVLLISVRVAVGARLFVAEPPVVPLGRLPIEVSGVNGVKGVRFGAGFGRVVVLRRDGGP